MSTVPEAFIPLNGSAGNSASVGVGGKRGSRKLKLVTRKQARKMLKKLGHKMRGGQEGDVVATAVDKKDAAVVMGGRKRGTKKTRRGRSLFGLKY
jgi:hypothetical protein